ncbi:MAG: peptidase S8 [Candidatus Eremiobacter antarcticus]|nr:MAG: peptidase S8 [Candidatus Eremiobacter sp. RRmetagenome_bin22]
MRKAPVLGTAAGIIAAAATVVMFAAPTSASGLPASAARTATVAHPAATGSAGNIQHLCAQTTKPGIMHCLALARTDVAHRLGVLAAPNATPSGYGPSTLQGAYKLPSSSAGSGQTVALVDAYDDPNAESDLGVYRSQYGLPSCTTANGCFRKLNQSGVQGSYTTPDQGWSQETSVDLDVASAICPGCHLMLVEGNTNSFADLAASVNTAVRAGATIVSNSYSGQESDDIVATFGPAYDHPGVIITVSSGDEGYGSSLRFPDDLNTVVSVGGTTLSVISPRTESAWSSAGSGCTAVSSPLTSQPAWQTADPRIRQLCSRRAYVDVSAVADPNTGVDVYDSYGMSGWLVFGGTSIGAPLIAGVYALAGNASSAGPAYPYNHSQSLNDVNGGSNGTCGGSGICMSSSHWDGPTGLGSPNGIGGF